MNGYFQMKNLIFLEFGNYPLKSFPVEAWVPSTTRLQTLTWVHSHQEHQQMCVACHGPRTSARILRHFLVYANSDNNAKDQVIHSPVTSDDSRVTSVSIN